MRSEAVNTVNPVINGFPIRSRRAMEHCESVPNSGRERGVARFAAGAAVGLELGVGEAASTALRAGVYGLQGCQGGVIPRLEKRLQ